MENNLELAAARLTAFDKNGFFYKPVSIANRSQAELIVELKLDGSFYTDKKYELVSQDKVFSISAQFYEDRAGTLYGDFCIDAWYVEDNAGSDYVFRTFRSGYIEVEDKEKIKVDFTEASIDFKLLDASEDCIFSFSSPFSRASHIALRNPVEPNAKANCIKAAKLLVKDIAVS